MERQTPLADPNIDPYALAQVHQLALQRMQQTTGMSNFSVRPLDSFAADKERANLSLKAEGQLQWDKNAPRVSNPVPSRLYSEGQGGNAAQSPYGGQICDPRVDLEKQANKESRLQTHEQDMEIGYEDKPSTPTFEGLEQRFLDEIMKLAKEQCDAEDAENARHRERIIEINAQYQEKLSSLRAQQAKRREEFLLKEARARLLQYQQQAGSNQYPTNASPIDPRGHGRAAANHYQTHAGPINPHGYGGAAAAADAQRPIDPHGYGGAAAAADAQRPVDPHGYGGAAAAADAQHPIDPRGYGGAAGATEAQRLVDPHGYGRAAAAADAQRPVDPRGYGGAAAAADAQHPIHPRGYGVAAGATEAQRLVDPRGYGGAAAAAEAQRAYTPGQFESYRERTPFVAGGRNQVTEARVPFPEGRVYNNAGAR